MQTSSSKGGGCYTVGCVIFVVLAVAGVITALVTTHIKETRAVAPFLDSQAQYQTACNRCAQTTAVSGAPSQAVHLLVVYQDGKAVGSTMAESSLKDLIATTPDDVDTLICVGNAVKNRVGSYTGGSTAYQITRDICVIDVSRNAPITRTTLYGSNPPKTKRTGESGTGSDPIGSVLTRFILSLYEKIE